MFSVVQDYEKENPNFLEKVFDAKVFLSVSQRAKMALIDKKGDAMAISILVFFTIV